MRSTRKYKFPVIAFVIGLATLALAIGTIVSYRSEVGLFVGIIVTGLILIVASELLPRFVGFTARHAGFTSGVYWGALIIFVALSLVTGWINVGDSFYRAKVKQSHYVTIVEPGYSPYSYELQADGSFGIVGTDHQFVRLGQINGVHLMFRGQDYVMLGGKILSDLPAAYAVGNRTLLVKFQ